MYPEHRDDGFMEVKPPTNAKKTTVLNPPFWVNSVTLRVRTWHLQKGVCHYCHRTIPLSKWNIDHKIPRSRGGAGLANKTGCCMSCNQAKANMTEAEFLVVREDTMARKEKQRMLQNHPQPDPVDKKFSANLHQMITHSRWFFATSGMEIPFTYRYRGRPLVMPVLPPDFAIATTDAQGNPPHGGDGTRVLEWSG